MGGTYHGFLHHLVNLLKEVVTDGTRTSARALAALFASDTYHYAIVAESILVVFVIGIFHSYLYAHVVRPDVRIRRNDNPAHHRRLHGAN
eukprot:3553079-Prymnesium_polylepis.1